MGIRRLAVSSPFEPLDALVYIARHHGLSTQAACERQDSALDTDALCLQARDLGLRSRVMRLEAAASLKQLQLPCLVQHRGLGWCLLLALHGDQVTLQDARRQRVSLPLDVLAVQLSGLAMEFRRAT